MGLLAPKMFQTKSIKEHQLMSHIKRWVFPEPRSHGKHPTIAWFCQKMDPKLQWDRLGRFSKLFMSVFVVQEIRRSKSCRSRCFGLATQNIPLSDILGIVVTILSYWTKSPWTSFRPLNFLYIPQNKSEKKRKKPNRAISVWIQMTALGDLAPHKKYNLVFDNQNSVVELFVFSYPNITNDDHLTLRHVNYRTTIGEASVILLLCMHCFKVLRNILCAFKGKTISKKP